MMLTLHQDTVAALGFDLDAAIADYLAAVTRHAASEGTPVPATHSLVERIVRGHGGAYRIVEAETGLEKGDPASIASRVQSLSDQVDLLKSVLLDKAVITTDELAG